MSERDQQSVIFSNSKNVFKPFRSPLKARPGVQDRAVVPVAQKRKANHHLANKPPSENADAVTSDNALCKPVKRIKVKVNGELQLEQELRQLQGDLDILEQVTAILSSSQPQRLPCAISKWRSIAKEAAEEIFESRSAQVRERGGLSNMLANSLSKSDSSEDVQLTGNRLSAEQQVELADAQAEADHNAKQYGLGISNQIENVEEEGHEITFTMPLMLRQLNIDSNLLARNDRRGD